MSQHASPTMNLEEAAALFGLTPRAFREKLPRIDGFPPALPGFKAHIWSRAAVGGWIDRAGGAPEAALSAAALATGRAALDANMGRAA